MAEVAAQHAAPDGERKKPKTFKLAADDDADLRPVDVAVAWRLLPFVRPHVRLLALGLAIMLLSTAVGLAGPIVAVAGAWGNLRRLPVVFALASAVVLLSLNFAVYSAAGVEPVQVPTAEQRRAGRLHAGELPLAVDEDRERLRERALGCPRLRALGRGGVELLHALAREEGQQAQVGADVADDRWAM